MDAEEIKKLIALARESGCAEIIIEGVKYVLGHPILGGPKEPVLDAKSEDLIKPLSSFEEIDEEEVLYWSSPYYDQYMADKEKKSKRSRKDIE